MPPDRPGEVVVPGASGELVGRAVAGVLRHLIAVLDREDRLESGTGEWLAAFEDDPSARSASIKAGVLRALHLASDGINFRMLEVLAASDGITRADLASRVAMTELSVAERVGDLVSAGLVVKLPEVNRVAGTPAGSALVEWVHEAVLAGAGSLGDQAS